MPDDALFTKDGAPVRFCFHRSVTQGRGRITRDVERHGGQIIADERTANVLLVDEQEDLEFLRRRYYSSTERYRLSIYVEPRGFVLACIRSGTYQHVGPVKQGMPGRAPGRGARPRVAFTEEDRDHLAYYLATRCPMRDGRMGNNPYKDLERLGQTDDATWAWARRHTWCSWREHYKMRPEMMDGRIEHYVRRLHNVGHHFGQDPRSHDHRNLQRQLAEEEEESGEEAWEGIERREEGGRAAPVPRRQRRAARDYLARHEEEILIIEDEEEDEEEEEEIVPQRVKRYRTPLDARRQDVPRTQAKRARVSADERQVSDGETSQDDDVPVNMETQESEEIEGSDLFGDRDYDKYNDQDVEYPAPFSPRASPGPPPSTQATLVASPRHTEKEPPATRPTKRAVDAHGQMPPPLTIPPSSQTTLVMDEGMRIPVRGPSADAGPSIPREKRVRRTDTPLARFEPQPQLDEGRKGKIKKEPVEEDNVVKENEGRGSNGISAFEDEKAVEGLLEATARDDEDTDTESDGGFDAMPRFMEMDNSEPSDSDDKETHGSLVRGGDEDDAERIERMANGKLAAAPPPTTTQTQISPRRTRSQAKGRR